MVYVCPVALLALFDDRQWARHAVAALKAVGFAGEDIGLLEPRRRLHGGHSSVASPGAIADALIGRGLTEDQARFYEAAVRRGNPLLAVRTRDEADVAQTVLQRCGAYDVQPFGRRPRRGSTRMSKATPKLAA
jgi:hypothetical protein